MEGTSKIAFWITVGVVAILFIFLMKWVASVSNIDGFKTFMSNI